MNGGRFGDGNLLIGWTSIEGVPGIQPRLRIKGNLIAHGYGIGCVVLVSAEVTAWGLATTTYAFLGTTTPRPYTLNWVKQRFALPHPQPADETIWDAEMLLPLDAARIEALEGMRQGKDFSLKIDTTVLIVERGLPLDENDPESLTNLGTHPTISWQEDLPVSNHVWGAVLEQWERAASIPVVVPIPQLESNPDRAQVVRCLRAARQKVNAGDYSSSIAETRKALELLRRMSPAVRPLPKKLNAETLISECWLWSIHCSACQVHLLTPTRSFVTISRGALMRSLLWQELRQLRRRSSPDST